MGKNPKTKVPKKKINYAVYFKNNWQLYVLILPAIIYFIVFNYMPLYGIQIAFKDFKAVLEFQEVNGLALNILSDSSQARILAVC